MKNLLIAFVMLSAVPAFAGKMKEIHLLVTESVMDTLGFDESVIKIESYDFVKVEGVDLAVKTTARSFYSVKEAAPTFDCLTTLKKQADESFSVIKTKCVEVK